MFNEQVSPDIDLRLRIEGKGSAIISKGRRGVAGFHARHFAVSRHCDGGAYLLSVTVLSFPPRPPKEDS